MINRANNILLQQKSLVTESQKLREKTNPEVSLQFHLSLHFNFHHTSVLCSGWLPLSYT